MPKPKDLYIATSLHDLNQKCSYDFAKGSSVKSHLNLVNKAYNAAELAHKDCDEERAFILYMRYADALSKIRKSKEFQQDAKHYNTLFGKSKLLTAIENAEKLSESLKKRYQKKGEKEAKTKDEDSKRKKVASNSGETVIKDEAVFVPDQKLTSQQLYEMLYKQKRDVIIMDVRSIEDYENSHMMHAASINVPNDAIKPGTVPSKIEQGIPLSFVKTWQSRHSAEIVVLLHWHSNLKRLDVMTDPLRSLKDSIYKWDQENKLKHQPVVLEGGYAEWLETYPQFTSNPDVKPPSNKPKTSNVNSLLDFSYSSLKINGFNNEDEMKLQNDMKVDEELGLSNGHRVDPPKPGKVLSDNSSATMPGSGSIPIANGIMKDDDIRTLAPGLYPKIDLNSLLPQIPPQIPTEPQDVIKPSTTSKPVPTFDRSNKPKPSSDGSKHNSTSTTIPNVPPVSNENGIDIKPNSLTPIVVDRSTKPKLTSDSNPTVSPHPDVNHEEPITLKTPKPNQEFLEMEQDLMQMQQKKEATEARLAEIEEKKKMAHLLSKRKKMQDDLEAAQKREFEAEKELADAMRGIKKPAESKSAPAMTTSLSSHPPEATRDLVKSPQKSDDLSPLSTRVLKHNVGDITEVGYKEAVQAKKTESDQAQQLSAASNKKISKQVKPDMLIQDKANSMQQDANKSSLPLENVDGTPHATVELPKNEKDIYATVKKPKLVANVNEVKPKNINKSIVAGKPTESSVKMAPAKNTASPVVPAHKPSTPKPTSTTGKILQKRLKDTNDDQSPKSGLKRSFSSPNIAKMVQEEEKVIEQAKVPHQESKPSLPSPSNQALVPSRELKSRYLEQPSKSVSDLSIQIHGVYGGLGSAICGLRNLINSCYMNSVLQCMFNTTQLAEYILTNSYRNDINRKNVLGHGGKVAENFAALLRAVWSGQYRYLVPSEMKSVAGTINPMFAAHSQEDSHEFLLMLLDALHEDLNRITDFKYQEEPDNDHLSDDDAAKAAWMYHKKRNESIIVELFSGQFKATVQCLHCRKTSRKFDVFRFLSLSLPQHSTSLHDVIKDFGKPEKMTGDDKWKCPSCKVLRDAVRVIEIWRLPPVLIIHFKRFVHTGRWREKIQTNISFPVSNLDLNSYTRGPAMRKPYNLYAVSHHHGGGLDSGHYTASCRSVVDNQWYKYDDTEVSRSSSPQGSSSFLLFYCCYPRQIPRNTPF
ncbi:unnamed protein product [Clavelina lepadiformis]|uniref:ubiquitinyl hydrolase 1 n=1 Tax=Clavelina lepadiformis TaxID=159417 RepID=A0ABP0F3Z6_CLALP